MTTPARASSPNVGVDRRDLRMRVEDVCGGAERARLVPAVVLGEREIGSVHARDADVASGGSAVVVQADEPDVREAVPDEVRRAVGRRVVDDHDLRRLGQRSAARARVRSARWRSSR
jgi:hypothetical protein